MRLILYIVIYFVARVYRVQKSYENCNEMAANWSGVVNK